MIKVENVDVWGFEHAIRGMRNPMNSWAKSDSYRGCRIMEGDCVTQNHSVGEPQKCDCCTWCEPLCYGEPERMEYIIGTNDLDLMKRLYKAGNEHRKFSRQIFASMDIIAPLYWWKEFDTYKVGTVANSCSTMHKIHAKKFTLDDFSCERLLDIGVYDNPVSVMGLTISCLNECRSKYIETGNKDYWWQMIQLLPSSYNQRRTVTFTYENVFSMIKQRSGHKLDEWNQFVEVLKNLPFVEDIMGE